MNTGELWFWIFELCLHYVQAAKKHHSLKIFVENLPL